MFKVLLSAMIVLGLMAISFVLIKASTPVKVKKTDNNRLNKIELSPLIILGQMTKYFSFHHHFT